jgi:hypothetical protein
MLIIRGLTVAFGGFAFIFLPGIIVSILTRRGLRFDANLLLWGMGVLVITLFPAYFLTNLLGLILFGESAPQPAMQHLFALVGSLIVAFFLEGGKYLLLRWRRASLPNLLGSGILLGLGIGLLTNIFQGISMVGAGFRLAFGDTSTSDLAKIAAQTWGELLAGLLALNVYRIALVAISALLGWLVAQALISKRRRWFWLAVGISAVTAWSYNAIGLALENQTLIANIVILIYQAGLAALALYWLIRQMPNISQQPVDQGEIDESKKKR